MESMTHPTVIRLTKGTLTSSHAIDGGDEGIGAKADARSSGRGSSSVCRRSGPDRSHGPEIRTGPKFGTGPKTGPSELPKVQYIFSVMKINIANLAALVVKDMCSKFSNYR